MLVAKKTKGESKMRSFIRRYIIDRNTLYADATACIYTANSRAADAIADAITSTLEIRCHVNTDEIEFVYIEEYGYLLVGVTCLNTEHVVKTISSVCHNRGFICIYAGRVDGKWKTSWEREMVHVEYYVDTNELEYWFSTGNAGDIPWKIRVKAILTATNKKAIKMAAARTGRDDDNDKAVNQ